MNGHDQKHEGYWTNAKLCRLVQNYPCFYDRSHPQYLKKDVVDKSWTVIAKEVKDSVASCKERWRNIRTAFARSINIYRTPSGPNRTKRYYLHDELQFLAKHITPGVPIRNSGQHDVDDSKISKNYIPEDEWTTDEQDICPEDDVTANNSAGGEATEDDYLEVQHDSPQQKRRRLTHETVDCKPEILHVTPEKSLATDYDTMFLNGLQILEQIFDSSNTTSTENTATTSYSNQNLNQTATSSKPSTIPTSQAFPVRTITIGTRNPTVKTVITSSELNILRNLSGMLNNKPTAVSVVQSNINANVSNAEILTSTNNMASGIDTVADTATSSTSSPAVNTVIPTPMTLNIDPVKVKDESL